MTHMLIHSELTLIYSFGVNVFHMEVYCYALLTRVSLNDYPKESNSIISTLYKYSKVPIAL